MDVHRCHLSAEIIHDFPFLNSVCRPSPAVIGLGLRSSSGVHERLASEMGQETPPTVYSTLRKRGDESPMIPVGARIGFFREIHGSFILQHGEQRPRGCQDPESLFRTYYLELYYRNTLETR